MFIQIMDLTMWLIILFCVIVAVLMGLTLLEIIKVNIILSLNIWCKGCIVVTIIRLIRLTYLFNSDH